MRIIIHVDELILQRNPPAPAKPSRHDPAYAAASAASAEHMIKQPIVLVVVDQKDRLAHTSGFAVSASMHRFT
jgi:hypothetical protein